MYLNLFQVDELPCVLRVLSYARGEINSRDMSLRGFHLCVCVCVERLGYKKTNYCIECG